MPGRRCLTCGSPNELRDGEVLRELTRSLLGVEAVFNAAPDGTAVNSCLRTLTKSNLVSFSGATVEELSNGWSNGDASTVVHVLNAVKDALGAGVARKDSTLKAPSRGVNGNAHSNGDARSSRRPVSALERLSGDAGFDFDEVKQEPTFDGLDTLRRLAGEPSDDDTNSGLTHRGAGSNGYRENEAPGNRNSRDPGSEAGSLRDWVSSAVKLKRSSHAYNSHDTAYAAAADAAEAAAKAYASRAEEARAARAAFLDDEALVTASAAATSPRLSTSPGANDHAARSFKGGTPAPGDTSYLPTPQQALQTWSTKGARVSRLTPEQQDVVVWILGLGIAIAGAAVTGDVVVSLPRATGIQSEMAKGVLLCRLVEALEGLNLGDVYKKPKVKAEATHNLNKALAVFRRTRRVAPRFLWSASDLTAGDATAAWGILGDIRMAYDASVVTESWSPGRVRGRRLRVTPRVDARGGAYGDPSDVEGRLPETPLAHRLRSPEPRRPSTSHSGQSRRFTPRSTTHSNQVTNDTATSASSGWRRAEPGVTLTSRGYPSPLARAAAKVQAARAKRVERLMTKAEKAEKHARVRHAVAHDSAQSASRAAFEAAAAEAEACAEQELLEEEEALLALELAAEEDERNRNAQNRMVEGSAGARFSRGGAVKGALSHGVKIRASSVAKNRPEFNPSGYVSPNEGGRVRSFKLTREGGFNDAKVGNKTERPRTAPTNARRGLSFASGADTGGTFSFGKSVTRKTELASSILKTPTAFFEKTQPNKVKDVAKKAAATAALSGAFPIVFEFRDAPLPVPPDPIDRDEEVRAWLETLRLSVLPREEHFPILSNPTRNGVLLCDVMTVLVGAPALNRRERNPRTLDQARHNVEKALAPLRTIPGAVPPGLTWSTEGILKGVRQHTFGLLWYVKRAALGRVTGVQARANETLEDVFGASPGTTPDAREGGFDRASTPAKSANAPKLFASSNTTASDSKTNPHYTGIATSTGNLKELGESVSSRNSPDETFLTVGETASKYGSPGETFGKGVTKIVTSRNTTPLLGYEALPQYDESNLKKLEVSLIKWLINMGLLDENKATKSFVALCPTLATGEILCDLVTAIEGVPVVGVFKNPKSFKTAEANAKRACGRLARHRNMSRKFLFRHRDIAAGVVGVLLGLLEDVRIFYDGLPPRTEKSKRWNFNVPYLPEDGRGMPVPPIKQSFTGPSQSPSRLLGGGRFEDRRRRDDASGDGDENNSDDEYDSSSDAPTALSAEPSEEPTRLGASVRVGTPKDTTHQSSTLKKRSPPFSPRVADRPEQAARAAATALEGWQNKLQSDLIVDSSSKRGGYKPTIPATVDRFEYNGQVGRNDTWELSSFPKKRATPREVDLYEQSVSRQKAAAAVAGAYAEKVPAKSIYKTPRPLHQAADSLKLTTAQRARNLERQRKNAAVSHAKSVSPEDSALYGGNVSASVKSKPPRPTRMKTPQVLVTASPHAPPSANPSSATAKSPNCRRPVKFVPPISLEQEARDARAFESVRLARWIESLGVSLRRAGASGASSGVGMEKGTRGSRVNDESQPRDPFADATRPPASELAHVCADGTLLCELVRVLENKEIKGVTWHPTSNASKLHNLKKALEELRRQPAMSPMHLWCEKDILACDEEMCVGLLGDMRACVAYRRVGRR